MIGGLADNMAGAFGSGSTFAMQDSWILAKAIQHTRSSARVTPNGLEVFDNARSPYYARRQLFIASLA
jgi:salicylate hydroxylase